MPKITIRDTDQGMTLKVAGALIGPWVDELERSMDLLQATRQNRPLRVDLTELTNVSPDGKRLLAAIGQDGAVFVSGNSNGNRFIDELTRRTSGRVVLERNLEQWPRRK